MGFLERGLLLYLLFAITVSISYPAYIFNTDGNQKENSPLSFINVKYNSSTGQPFYETVGGQTMTNTAAGYANETTSQPVIQTGVTILTWIDGLKQVFSWVGLFFKFLLSPVIFLAGIAGVASPLTVMIGLPLVILFLLGLLYFVRSGA